MIPVKLGLSPKLLALSQLASPCRPNLHHFSQIPEPRPGSLLLCNRRQIASVTSLMDVPALSTVTEKSSNIGGITEEEYDYQAKLLQEFYKIPSIEKVWISKPCTGNALQAMVSMSQTNLSANKKRTFVLSMHIPEEIDNPANCHWSSFPVEQIGASLVVPSPSGLNLLVVRNGEPSSKDASASVQLEIWGPAQLRKEIFIPPSVHGPVYTDEWFQGISWNWDETCIAYVAEEPACSQPVFTSSGYKAGASGEKEPGSWKGQGDWLEDWGETYAGKRRPALFLVDIKSGIVQAAEGIPNNLSVGQVIWAPPGPVNGHQYLVFVGWSPDAGNSHTSRKLGMKYCYNRPCALYALRSPLLKRDSSEEKIAIKLTAKTNSAFWPRFSPNRKFLIFLSASTAVTTGAHCATNSLHKLQWPSDGMLHPNMEMEDVVPVVTFPEKGSFPGLYCTDVLAHPWLSDGHTIVLSSIWGSMQVLVAVNVLSGNVLRISPADSNLSWSVLAVQDDNVLAVSSSLVKPQSLNYGHLLKTEVDDGKKLMWNWMEIPVPFMDYSDNVKALLSLMDFKILKIPVTDHEAVMTEGAKQPFEAIFVSSRQLEDSKNVKGNVGRDACNPLIVILHGGPHSVSLTSYSKSFAFLSSLGYNLLLVNYRGSLGYGEDALQSLPGNIGCQDVADVLAAIDTVVGEGLADQTNIAVLGGSHGGFLATHLIGQAPDRFVTAAVRNPVCNLSLMVGTSDIADWCYVETFGRDGENAYTEAPSTEDLNMFYHCSPISHISKVKVPTLFLFGAQDLRVPISNGLQYVRALREKGLEVKVIVFPNDVHSIDRPQSDFESYLNIGVWFKRFFK